MKLVTDSHFVQNTLNSLQSLNSLKPLMNDSIATHPLRHHDPKPSEYSQIERISSVQKKSVVNTNESEKCPFKSNNRSPDSFIRISTNGKDDIHPNITRVSLLSMVQNSETKTSHISQKSSMIQTEQNKSLEQLSQQSPFATAKEVQPKAINMSQQLIRPIQVVETSQHTSLVTSKLPTPTNGTKPKSNNNIEINIEKILQIIQLLEGIMNSQQNLILVNDFRHTLKQNKDYQAKFERINEERLHSTVNLCEEWWNVIREPTVSQQLNKSIKILSHVKI